MINEVKGAQQAVVHNISNNQQADKADKAAHQTDAAAAQSSSKGAGQEVSLTDTAATLKQLENQIANQPVVDPQRVESVKKAIADGSFKIDANHIADKMAEFEQLLADKNSQS